MSDRAPYSRVYWSIVDDPKFASIYDDDRHLATWLRLLVIADQAHPASANIPTGTRKASLDALAASGLVDLGTGHRYRIHGLDAERKRRRDAATRGPGGTPSAPQTGPKPDPDGFHTTGLRRDEHRQDEASRAEQDARADPWDAPETPALAWLSEHGCHIRPGDGYHQKLVLAVEVHGVEPIVETMGRLFAAGTKRGDTKGLMFGAIDNLNAMSRPNLRSIAPEPKPRQPRKLEPWEQDFKATLEAHEATLGRRP